MSANRGVPGTVCRLRANWWDGQIPPEGDFLRTEAGACYRIDEWRPARASAASLGVFVCTRLEHDAVSDEDEGVHRWSFWSAR